MKMLLVACLATLSLAAGALAQPQSSSPPKSPPQPQMPTGGSERALSSQKVVGEAPDQILLRNVVGDPLYGRGINQLGTVTDALIDPHRGTVDVVILDTIRGSKPRTISWHALDLNNRKHVSADLSVSAIESTSPVTKNGKPLEQRVGKKPGLVSAKKELLGQRVVGRDGKTLGTVHDAVVDERSGRLVAAVIDAGQGITFDGGSSRRVVPWSVVSLPSAQGQPVAVHLTRAEIEQEPTMLTLAPAPPEKVGPGVGSSSGTLGNRGHKVPLPPRSPSTQRTE